ncbi:hypothetical protein BaRGS_00032389, partial [Batillaria attramentaria]
MGISVPSRISLTPPTPYPPTFPHHRDDSRSALMDTADIRISDKISYTLHEMGQVGT